MKQRPLKAPRTKELKTPPEAKPAALPQEEANPPDVAIATFITNHNAIAHVVATGPRDRRAKVVHFTFPNGETHAATIGAVLVLRELCDQVIRTCGTDVLVPQPTVPSQT